MSKPLSDSRASDIARMERRRRWLVSEKQRIVEESRLPGASVGGVCRRYGIAPAVLSRWRKLAREGRFQGIAADESEVPESEIQAMRRKLRDLQQVLGRMTEQIETLREAVEVASGRMARQARHAAGGMQKN